MSRAQRRRQQRHRREVLRCWVLYPLAVFTGWLVGMTVHLHDHIEVLASDPNGADPIALLVWVGVSAGLCYGVSQWKR